MTRILRLMALASASIFGTACAASNSQPTLKTVSSVDVGRYLGSWHEIARYPAGFQKDCYKSQANYSLDEDGYLKVVNTCRKGSPAGEVKTAEAKAWIVDKTTNAKLKVQFFWPFKGDYWIIDLGKDYEYAVVGEPSREYLWILSRTPEMEDGVYQAISSRLRENGYDPARLIRQ